MNPKLLQTLYIIGGILVLPFAPYFYWQGQRVRKRVGRLPDAAGATVGRFGEHAATLNLLAIGESTVAGVGARHHAEALGGQFAKYLSLAMAKSVRWHVLGESGITVGGTLERLVPQLPETAMDFVVVALGGNDTFKVSSPNRWRGGMTKLVRILREKYPQATILLANTPRIVDFTALPPSLKFVLRRISRLHHENAKNIVRHFENVFYYDEATKVGDDFFADGVHPSAHGYALWSEAMVKSLLRKMAAVETK
ncbi:MAG: SGNH/GDSL hydrolase family protein [Pyrinomonadaceae bacterium]|nr:SGNH/GDSL hydrolase family protein [Pyrinomonadaceae bacterium]